MRTIHKKHTNGEVNVNTAGWYYDDNFRSFRDFCFRHFRLSANVVYTICYSSDDRQDNNNKNNQNVN